jgi:hypothetical protein
VGVVVFLLTAVIFTWPLAWHLADAIPTGVRPPTVALFGLFTMEWTAQAVEHGASYWDAPMFHPHGGAFAWSEPQPFTSLVVWLLSKVTGTVLAYNLVLLSYLVMTGLAGYALARQLTDDHVAALWAGLWITAGAYPIQQLTVLHLLAGLFPVACLALLLALARRTDVWIAGAAGLAYFLTWMTCAQFGLLLTVLLPFVVVPLIYRRGWCWKTAVTVITPMVAGLLLALPFLLTQRALLGRMGFERSLEDVQGAYALLDLFVPARGHWLTSRVLHLTDAPGIYPFDMGVAFFVCLLAAGIVGGLRFWKVGPTQARQRVALVAMSAAALLLGFGPNLGVTVAGERIGPYMWFRSIVPGLEAMRTPARFGMFATVGIAALAAAAFAFLRARSKARGARCAMTVAAFGLLLGEMWAMPIGLADPGLGIKDHREVTEWLRTHGEQQAVLELPMAENNGETALAREVRAMRRALRHGHPIVNGYSAYFPEPFIQVRDAIRRDVAGQGRRYFGALGVRDVLLHDHEFAPSRARTVAAALGGRIVFQNDRHTVVRLEADEPTTTSRPPATAQFQKEPRKGAALGIPFTPFPRARFVAADPGQILRISWADNLGLTHNREIVLRGSVLVDAGVPWILLRVLRPPTAKRSGEAVLIAPTRVSPPASARSEELSGDRPGQRPGVPVASAFAPPLP